MNRSDKTLTARERDNKARWWYYRPFILLIAGSVVCLIVLTIGAITLPTRLRKEWEGVPVQQGEATCIRSESHFPNKRYWWDSTYLIRGTEHTEQGPDSCIAGKQYALLYQIGHHGRLAVISRKLL